MSLSTNVELFDLVWSPDSKMLAAATSTGVKIFDNNLAEIAQLTGHGSYVFSVAWKPDGTQLASGGSVGDNAIRIWDYDSVTEDFSLRAIIPTVSDIVLLLKWSPDGTKLASLVELGTALTRHPELMGDVQIWDAETFEPLRDEPGWIDVPARSMDWSPDSTRVVVGGQGRVVTFGTDALDSWGIRLDFATDSVSWSSDNRVAFDDLELEIVDGDTGQFLYTLDLPVTPNVVYWHPDGNYLLVNGIDNGLGILNGNTGDVLMNIPQPTGEWPWRFAWRPDGNRLAAATKDGIIQIWDTGNLPDISGTPTLTPYPTQSSTPSHRN